MKHILYCFLIILVCTSCWDRRELNELAIVSAIGFDLNDEGYEVTLQIVNPKEVSNQQAGYDSPITTYKETGKTVMESIRKLTDQLPRKAYFSHLRVVIIGEALAKAGFADVVDFLQRDHEMRSDFYFMVSRKTSAKESLEILTSLENVPANKLFNSFEVSEEFWGATEVINVNDLVRTLISDGKQLTLSSLGVEGPVGKGKLPENVESTNEPTTLKYEGVAVFNKDRLTGWLNDEESKNLHLIIDEIKRTVINIPYTDGAVAIEILTSKSKMKGVIDEGRPKIILKIKLSANIADVESHVGLLSLKQFKQVEQNLSEKVKKDIEHVIQKAQHELQEDIFGFGEEIYRTSPKDWQQLKKNWSNEFQQIEVITEVEVEIKHKGTLRKSLHEYLKE